MILIKQKEVGSSFACARIPFFFNEKNIKTKVARYEKLMDVLNFPNPKLYVIS